MGLILPQNYDPHLTVRETQEAIKYIRDTFQKEFGREMHLERISAPLFVAQSSGLNDNLNGIERPVGLWKLSTLLPNGSAWRSKNTAFSQGRAFIPI